MLSLCNNLHVLFWMYLKILILCEDNVIQDILKNNLFVNIILNLCLTNTKWSRIFSAIYVTFQGSRCYFIILKTTL